MHSSSPPTQVTATVGHLYSLDFAPQYNDWNRHPPAELFHAPVVHMEDPRPRMSAHLAQEAKGLQRCGVGLMHRWKDGPHSLPPWRADLTQGWGRFAPGNFFGYVCIVFLFWDFMELEEMTK